MKLSNGVETVPVEGEEADTFANLFHAYKLYGLLRVGPERYILPNMYTRWAEEYLNFEFRSNDILIVTYPKCGTTWMQEILWTMVHNPDLNNPDAAENLAVRVPFLEFDCLASMLTAVSGHNPLMVDALAKLAPKASPDDGIHFQLAKHITGPRIIKTHLPFSLLPEKLLDSCKVVYVARNPKDVVCSYLHHHRIIKVHDYHGTDEQLVDYYCKGELMYGDYAAHLAEALARRHHHNFSFYLFEDLKKDTIPQLSKINTFLDLGCTETQLKNVAKQSTFDSMKERMSKRLSEETDIVAAKDKKEQKKEPEKAGFFRKGKSGSWKTDLKPELIAKIDKWTEEKITKPLGMTFTYGN